MKMKTFCITSFTESLGKVTAYLLLVVLTILFVTACGSEEVEPTPGVVDENGGVTEETIDAEPV